jgi:integrase
VLTLSLGLRRGEVLALRWDDLDLDRRQITIGRQLRRVRNQKLADGSYPDGRRTRLDFSTPKTDSSIATMVLPETAIAVLRRHRLEQATERLEASERADDSLVFTTAAGAPIDPDTFRKDFSALCAAAGLGHRNPHQLRHSAATILLGQGVPLHEVKDILRHSSISVTKDIYGHLTAERMRAGADAMDTALHDARSVS